METELFPLGQMDAEATAFGRRPVHSGGAGPSPVRTQELGGPALGTLTGKHEGECLGVWVEGVAKGSPSFSSFCLPSVSNGFSDQITSFFGSQYPGLLSASVNGPVPGFLPFQQNR